MASPDLDFTHSELALTAGDIVHLHDLFVARHGGGAGVRDHAILDAIVGGSSPVSTREIQADDVFSNAAGYAYQIGVQRPFASGNAGTGLLAALVYLQLAGIVVDDPLALLGQAMTAVSTRAIDRAALAALLRRLAKE